MSIVVPNHDELGFARIICEAMMIVLIALEPVKNAYLKRFVKYLIAAFILEELVIIADVFLIYMNIINEWTIFIWRTYGIIRLFISMSLCYPMTLFIGQNLRKLQRLLIAVCCLIIYGVISESLGNNNGHSGIYFIAFLLIFIFTFYQYTQLRRRTGKEIPRLKSLMTLELTLIILNSILIVLFFNNGFEQNFLPAIKITIDILQYHKFYMIISVMTYFE
jgi:hypothetical protein